MIDSIANDPDFTSLNSIINWNALKEKPAEEIKAILDNIFKLMTAAGYPVIGTMYNHDGASHIFPVYNGQSLDINYQNVNGNSFDWGSPVNIFVSIGGSGRWDTVLKNAVKYGTFDFRDKWIEDKTDELYKKYKGSDEYKNKTDEEIMQIAKNDANDKYSTTFSQQYSYNFYILNYTVLMMTDISSQWGFISF